MRGRPKADKNYAIEAEAAVWKEMELLKLKTEQEAAAYRKMSKTDAEGDPGVKLTQRMTLIGNQIAKLAVIDRVLSRFR